MAEKNQFKEKNDETRGKIRSSKKLKDDFTKTSDLIDISLNRKNYLAAVLNCKQLLKLSKHDNNIYHKNKEKYLQSCNLLKKENQKKYKEERKIKKNILDLDGIIDIEADNAPELEEISLESLIVDNSEINDMYDQANDVLEQYRNEVEKHVKSKGVLITNKQYAIPLEQKTIISRNFQYLNQEKPEKILKKEISIEMTADIEYNLTDSTDDPIEEAFIEDIIPYDYEIKEIEFVNTKPTKSPVKHMVKDGLQLNWHLSEIKQEDNFSIRYHLRPRISRTIVLPSLDHLKVIKTRSSLKDEVEESNKYTTFLKFNNEFAEELNQVIMEDLIPRSFVYEVEEIKSNQFPSSMEEQESLVKWKIYEVPENESTHHEYELTEINTIEQMKYEAYEILKEEEDHLTSFSLKKKKDEARKFLQKFHHVSN